MKVRPLFVGALCAATLGLSVVGCGNDDSAPAPTSSSSAQVAPSVQATSSSAAVDQIAPAPTSVHTTTPPQGGTEPCEGTVCTNPNHGAGTDPESNGGAVMPNPNGDGSEVPCEGTICTNPNQGAGS